LKQSKEDESALRAFEKALRVLKALKDFSKAHEAFICFCSFLLSEALASV
jgi:hypothetical protein